MRALDRLLQALRVRQVLPYLKPSSSLLDVGCADGALLRAAPTLARYVGIDPAVQTQRVSQRARFLNGVFPHPELASEPPFDVIAALAVFEHVPSEAQRPFAEAAAAQLVPGGLLIMTVPHPFVDRILDVLLFFRLLDGMETEQHHGFDPASIGPLFAAHGLTLERHARFELGLNNLFVFRRV